MHASAPTARRAATRHEVMHMETRACTSSGILLSHSGREDTTRSVRGRDDPASNVPVRARGGWNSRMWVSIASRSTFTSLASIVANKVSNALDTAVTHCVAPHNQAPKPG